MPATIRIDFETHAEQISKALQAEFAKIQSLTTQFAATEESSHKESVKRKSQVTIQEEQKTVIAVHAFKLKAEQEIAEMRAAFSAQTWGSEKKAAEATVAEIKKMMERKDVIRRSLEDASLDESVKAEMEAEKKKLEINLATMRRIALENKEIREHGAGGAAGILGQGRNIDEINIKATKLKSLFASGLGIAAVATSMGIFSKSTGEAVDQIASVATAGLGMAASIGGVAKAVLTAAQAQKVLNVAMAAAPWAIGIAAIAVIIGYWDKISEALKKAWEWVKKAYAAFNDFFESLGPLGTALKYLVAPITLVIDGVSALVGLFEDSEVAQKDATVATEADTVAKKAATKANIDYSRSISKLTEGYKQEKESTEQRANERRDAALRFEKEEKSARLRGDMVAAEELRKQKEQNTTIFQFWTAELVKMEAAEKAFDDKNDHRKKDKEKKDKDFSQKIADEKLLALSASLENEQKKEQQALEIKYQQDLHEAKGSAELIKLVKDRHLREIDALDAKYQQIRLSRRVEERIEINRIEAEGEAEQLRRLQERINTLLEVKKIEADGEAEQMRRLSERIALEVEVIRIRKEGEEAARKAFQEQIQAYTQIGQSIFSLIGAIKDLNSAERERNKELDEALQRQLAAHEAMSESNAGLAKDEKEAQAIRKKGEEQRSAMMQQREAEEDAAAAKQEEAMKRQNTANLLGAASSMVMAIAQYMAAEANKGLLALATIPVGIGLIMAMFQASKSGLGFRKGGYTGDGREDEEAGIVHKKEFVLPAGTFARDSQGKIISIDPKLIGGSSDIPSESIRMGSFINLTGDKGQKADQSIRMGSFINVIGGKLDRLIAAVEKKRDGPRSRMMYQRSLNRESV